jgi:alpha-tubulin suppressor-like RCC1 family protein
MRFLAAAAVAVAGVAVSFAGAAMPRTLAVPASSLIGISPGNGFTCAVTSAGGVKCWGTNEANILGTVNSNSVDTLTPSDVLGLTSGVTAVSVNNAGGFDFACALTRVGGVKCWGSNEYGQLGIGRSQQSTPGSAPASVVGLTSGVKAITVGEAFACALTRVGGVKCWGWNGNGVLGNGGSSAVPVSVVGLTSGVKAITAGASFACALTSAGGVVCWGDDNNGELGQASQLGLKQTNNNVWSPTPIGVVGLSSGVKAIAAGLAHACALTSGGGVECWGDNSLGQLGNGLTPTYGNLLKGFTPGAVVGLTSGVTAITAGASDSTCALINGGGVECWGDNTDGQLGDGSKNPTEFSTMVPVRVVGLSSGVTAIAVGLDHTCALVSGGGAKCWGANFAGQLGNGSMTESRTPVNVRLSATPAAK